MLEEYIKAEDAGSSDEERKRDDGDRGRGRMRVGDRIEARYRGRSRYYPGRIARDRGDGTFDVDCATQRLCLHTRGRRPAAGFDSVPERR